MKIFNFLSAFLLFSLIMAPAVQAKVPWQTNKLRAQKKWEKLAEKIDRIPVFRDKIDGHYDILGPVHAQDAFTRKQTAIVRKMRTQAYKMGADAIMEFRCRKMVKSLFQNCEGFAIKYLEHAEPENEDEDKKTVIR